MSGSGKAGLYILYGSLYIEARLRLIRGNIKPYQVYTHIIIALTIGYSQLRLYTDVYSRLEYSLDCFAYVSMSYDKLTAMLLIRSIDINLPERY